MDYLKAIFFVRDTIIASPSSFAACLRNGKAVFITLASVYPIKTMCLRRAPI